jgi:putative transposase
MQKGFFYLVVIMDWYSRFVLSWELSNTMDVGFCMEALEKAMARAKPQIFNSDQGSQYTSTAFTQRLLEAEIQISMDGKGRCFDNIFIERLWRTLKYEDIYLKDYTDGHALWHGLSAYLDFYNHQRLHQSLAYRPPAEVYFAA